MRNTRFRGFRRQTGDGSNKSLRMGQRVGRIGCLMGMVLLPVSGAGITAQEPAFRSAPAAAQNAGKIAFSSFRQEGSLPIQGLLEPVMGNGQGWCSGSIPFWSLGVQRLPGLPESDSLQEKTAYLARARENGWVFTGCGSGPVSSGSFSIPETRLHPAQEAAQEDLAVQQIDEKDGQGSEEKDTASAHSREESGTRHSLTRLSDMAQAVLEAKEDPASSWSPDLEETSKAPAASTPNPSIEEDSSNPMAASDAEALSGDEQEVQVVEIIEETTIFYTPSPSDSYEDVPVLEENVPPAVEENTSSAPPLKSPDAEDAVLILPEDSSDSDSGSPEVPLPQPETSEHPSLPKEEPGDSDPEESGVFSGASMMTSGTPSTGASSSASSSSSDSASSSSSAANRPSSSSNSGSSAAGSSETGSALKGGMDMSRVDEGFQCALSATFLEQLREGKSVLEYQGARDDAVEALSELVTVYCSSNTKLEYFHETLEDGTKTLRLTDQWSSWMTQEIRHADEEWALYLDQVEQLCRKVQPITSLRDRIDAINAAICTNYTYKITNKGMGDFARRKVGQCWHFAKLFCDVCLASGMDAELHSTISHSWVSICVDGTTYRFDPAFNATCGSITAYSWQKI